MLGSRQGQIIGIRCLCPVILASRLTKVILLILTCSSKVWVLLLSNKIYKTKQGFYLYLLFRDTITDITIYYKQTQLNELTLFMGQLIKQFKSSKNVFRNPLFSTIIGLISESLLVSCNNCFMLSIYRFCLWILFWMPTLLIMDVVIMIYII